MASKMEELQLHGIERVDDEDWAAEGQKRVINGSDGLWCRFGFAPGESCKSQCAAFRFNPCVSLFAVILLFSLVGFCSIQPSGFCTQNREHFMFNVGDAGFEATATVPQPSKFPGGWDTHLSFMKGTGLDALVQVERIDRKAEPTPILVNSILVNDTSVLKTGTLKRVDLTIADKIEQVDCFMPMLEFSDWMKWVTECFTWLYIITQDVWIIFVVWLCFSRYGKIKLGRDEDEPEFTYFAWFAMLFTCGVATGLFYFAVSEPQYYYLTNNAKNDGYSERTRWAFAGVYEDSLGVEHPVYSTPNDRAQNAMTTTWYHWGLHGWVCYCILGLLLGFLHFRKGLPMTIKSCFYPLIGTRIYGFSGDFLDTISVVATTMGVCTSLGLGVMQLNSGIELLNGDQHWMGLGFYNEHNFAEWMDKVPDLKSYWDSYSAADKLSKPWFKDGVLNIKTAAGVATIEAQNNQQMLLIWLITALATCSVMAGLKRGIKALALLCLALGQFLIFYVWVMDDTWFLTNLFIQTIGHYVQNMPTLGFYSSAVEQSEVNNPYGEYQSWQFWWTIFYWGWWIAWAPFVGVFLARIGKGRTIREFIFCTLFAACIYNFLFMNMLGGAGLKMQMLAEKYNVGTTPRKGLDGKFTIGLGCDGDTLVVDPAGNYITKSYRENICRPASTRKYSGEKEYFCSTITNLACSLNVDSTRPLFDVLGQYSDVGKGLITITTIALTLYFVASSDSGSMVDDMLTANGLTEPCLAQRFFWAMTEGAAASALLSVGKYVGKVDGGLKALRAASICVGLPYTFIICFMCLALVRALQYETKERNWNSGFRSSVTDFGLCLYQCGDGINRKFNMQKGKLDCTRICKLIKNWILPPIALCEITGKLADKKNASRQSKMGLKLMVAGAVLLFYAWFILDFVDYAPVSDTPQEWGSIQGNESALSGNKRYYVSNRYGYYHEWANQADERDAGSIIKYNAYNPTVDRKAQEAGGSERITGNVNGESVSVGVGDRMSHSLRIAAFGWFFFFCFVTYLTSVRGEVRQFYKIPGSMGEDFLVSLFWPMALLQMQEQVDCPVTNLEMPDKLKDDPVEVRI